MVDRRSVRPGACSTPDGFRARPTAWAALILSTVLLLPSAASAHRDDYLNETLVYLTVEKGEIEPEYWFDLGRDRAADRSFTAHHASLEYGITERFMVDGRGSVLRPEGGPARFSSGRAEARYRFYDEGVLPVDVAASAEVNWEREASGTREYGLEPRVVFSKDLREEMNFTVNLSGEIPLEGGGASFLTALGGRWDWGRVLRAGSELQYDTRAHLGSVIPQVWLAVSPNLTVKLGYAHGFDRNRSDFGRLAFEADF